MPIQGNDPLAVGVPVPATALWEFEQLAGGFLGVGRGAPPPDLLGEGLRELLLLQHDRTGFAWTGDVDDCLAPAHVEAHDTCGATCGQ